MPAAEQFLDIEIALGMTTAGRVGVGEFVDQRDLRVAGDDGVEIHLLERLPLVFEASAGNDLESPQAGPASPCAHVFRRRRPRYRSRPASGRVRLLQHLVGLADAGSRADENLEPAGSALFSPGSFEQGFRRGSLVRIAPLIHHQESNSLAWKASSIRLSAPPRDPAPD